MIETESRHSRGGGVKSGRAVAAASDNNAPTYPTGGRKDESTGQLELGRSVVGHLLD